MDQEEINHLEKVIRLHRKNLQILEENLARYGPDAPPHLINRIEVEREKLERSIQQKEKVSGAAIKTEKRSLPLQNLPRRDDKTFIGRKKELDEILHWLSPEEQGGIIAIEGVGGIGKTSLASEAAYHYQDNYSSLPEDKRFEAIVWVSAKPNYLTANGILPRSQAYRTLQDLFAAIASVLDYPAITRAPQKKQQNIVVRVLRQHRTLLIVDNLETIQNDELMSFLMDLPMPSKAIVTTRHRIDVPYSITIKRLPEAEAIKLISQEDERKKTGLTDKEKDELLRRTGGVPLAIVWSIGLIRLGLPPRGVFKRLGSGQDDIAKFCFEESVSQIRSENAHKLLLSFSLFYIDADVEAIGYISGFTDDHDAVEEGLSKLIRSSLINKEGERYSLLPLTREFVKSEACKDSIWLEAAQERCQSYFYKLAKELGGYSKDSRGQERVEREMSNILMVIEAMIDKLEFEKANDGNLQVSQSSMATARMLLDFTRVVIRTCRIRGYWSDCETLCKKSIQICKALNDVDSIGWRYYDLCRISYLRGDFESASKRGEDCRKEWQRVGLSTSQALRLLGLIALAQNRIAEAEKYITEAFSEYKRLRKEGTLSLFQESLGKLAEKKGDYQDALKWYMRAAATNRRKKDLAHLTISLIDLGNLYMQMENYAAAKKCFQESVKRADECGRVDNIADAAFGLGLLQFKTNNLEEAKKYLQQATELYRRLDIKSKHSKAEAILTRIK